MGGSGGAVDDGDARAAGGEAAGEGAADRAGADDADVNFQGSYLRALFLGSGSCGAKDTGVASDCLSAWASHGMAGVCGGGSERRGMVLD